MAIAFTYDESDNKVVVTGGTSGIPATFADFVTADRAGTAELTPEDAPVACTTNITLTYQIRPVEDLALQITFTLAGTSAGAGDTLDITGTDWRGAAQSESIDVSAGDGAYTGAKYWRTITDIDCTGWADGTLKVTQGSWGIISDYGGGQYYIAANFTVGNGSTTTYFTDTNKNVVIGTTGTQLAFIVTAAATFQLGEKGTGINAYHSGGCFATFKPTILNGTVKLYGAILRIYCGYQTFNFSCAVDHRNSLFYSEGSGIVYIAGSTGIVDNCKYINNGGTYFYPYASDITWSNIYVSDFTYNIVFTYPSAQGLLKNVISQSGSSGDIYVRTGSSYYLDVRNLNTDSPTVGWSGADTCAERLRLSFEVDIHVADKDGVNLSGVTVKCEDKNDNSSSPDGFSVSTAADGTITQQSIRRKTWSYSGGNVMTDHSPHKFTLSKAGYETLILDNITVDGPIDWYLELQAQKQPPALWQEGMM